MTEPVLVPARQLSPGHTLRRDAATAAALCPRGCRLGTPSTDKGVVAGSPTSKTLPLSWKTSCQPWQGVLEATGARSGCRPLVACVSSPSLACFSPPEEQRRSRRRRPTPHSRRGWMCSQPQIRGPARAAQKPLPLPLPLKAPRSPRGDLQAKTSGRTLPSGRRAPVRTTPSPTTRTLSGSGGCWSQPCCSSRALSSSPVASVDGYPNCAGITTGETIGRRGRQPNRGAPRD
ncbi:FXYD domain-containing ion transport regulator 5 isoform X1 [Panthera tigris]|uniref:FXYD domain-containing ion transport regulator 5 isoform X1 n=1 Tax=Panthera tigris TaxID=9694 RepID=UPI001C6F88C1|nr:FXYD domain-containing ion transport regulator 5 isoform X1 [Panthera tigris]